MLPVTGSGCSRIALRSPDSLSALIEMRSNEDAPVEVDAPERDEADEAVERYELDDARLGRDEAGSAGSSCPRAWPRAESTPSRLDRAERCWTLVVVCRCGSAGLVTVGRSVLLCRGMVPPGEADSALEGVGGVDGEAPPEERVRGPGDMAENGLDGMSGRWTRGR